MSFNTVKDRSELCTHEGGLAYYRSPADELYLLVASSMMAGDSFYESLDDRLDRFRDLVDHVSQEEDGPEFLAGLCAWARKMLNMRTAPTVLAAEMLQRGLEYAEEAAASTWVRGDEMLEALAYVESVGEKRTKKLLRAVSTGLNRLSDRAAMKYKRKGRKYTLADAVRLAHPKPLTVEKSALFKWISRGWDALDSAEKGLLPTVAAAKAGTHATWEQEISAEGSTKESWTHAVDKMGYMALLRNLRNLVKNCDEDVLSKVAWRISSPGAIRNSHQLPYRFFSALRALPDEAPEFLRQALSDAMDVSANAIPALDGDTVVLVDRSGSMCWRFSPRSDVSRIDVVALLAAALARQGNCSVWAFGGDAVKVDIPAETPVLMGARAIKGAQLESLSTHTERALRRALGSRFSPPRRTIVLTDGQAHDAPGPFMTKYLDANPETVAYVVDVAGERPNPFNVTHPRLFSAGGFSDRVFDWINALEMGSPKEAILAFWKGYNGPDNSGCSLTAKR